MENQTNNQTNNQTINQLDQQITGEASGSQKAPQKSNKAIKIAIIVLIFVCLAEVIALGIYFLKPVATKETEKVENVESEEDKEDVNKKKKTEKVDRKEDEEDADEKEKTEEAESEEDEEDDDKAVDKSEEKKNSKSDEKDKEIVDEFTGNTFQASDGSVIYFEEDGSFAWYQKDEDHSDNYYAGTYDIYLAEDALDHIINDMPSYGVTEQEMEDYFERNEDSSFYRQENFCCVILHTEELIIGGENQADEPYDKNYMGFYQDGVYDATNMDSAQYAYFEMVE